jgi:hypothetical protein
MSKTFPKQTDKTFDLSFSSAFVFNRVFGCFSAMGVQRHYKKNVLQKIVSKVFTKNRQKSKTDFFSIF